MKRLIVCILVALLCFGMAACAQTSVSVDLDQVKGQMMETLRLPEAESPRPDTSAWAAEGNAKTRKNLITSIFLNAPQQEAHNIHLQAKYREIEAAEPLAECYRTDDADIILAAYGTSSRICRSAVDALREEGIKVGMFRPQTLYPFPTEALRKTVDGKKLFVVEMSSGQFRDDCALHLGRLPESIPLVNRMGGILVTVEQVIDAVKASI